MRRGFTIHLSLTNKQSSMELMGSTGEWVRTSYDPWRGGTSILGLTCWHLLGCSASKCSQRELLCYLLGKWDEKLWQMFCFRTGTPTKQDLGGGGGGGRAYFPNFWRAPPSFFYATTSPRGWGVTIALFCLFSWPALIFARSCRILTNHFL